MPISKKDDLIYPIQVIYATLQNSLDVVISLLDPATLDVRKTYRTNWRKQWSGNAFMACGVLYVLKKYDEKYTSLNYMYNTHTGTLFIYKALNIGNDSDQIGFGPPSRKNDDI